VEHYIDRVVPSQPAKYLHRIIDQADVSPYFRDCSTTTW
jgi:hypothetical protein